MIIYNKYRVLWKCKGGIPHLVLGAEKDSRRRNGPLISALQEFCWARGWGVGAAELVISRGKGLHDHWKRQTEREWMIFLWGWRKICMKSSTQTRREEMARDSWEVRWAQVMKCVVLGTVGFGYYFEDWQRNGGLRSRGGELSALCFRRIFGYSV